MEDLFTGYSGAMLFIGMLVLFETRKKDKRFKTGYKGTRSSLRTPVGLFILLLSGLWKFAEHKQFIPVYHYNKDTKTHFTTKPETTVKVSKRNLSQQDLADWTYAKLNGRSMVSMNMKEGKVIFQCLDAYKKLSFFYTTNAPDGRSPASQVPKSINIALKDLETELFKGRTIQVTEGVAINMNNSRDKFEQVIEDCK